MQSDCRFNLKQRWSQFVFGWWHKSTLHEHRHGHVSSYRFFVVYEIRDASVAITEYIGWFDVFGMRVPGRFYRNNFMIFEIILNFYLVFFVAFSPTGFFFLVSGAFLESYAFSVPVKQVWKYDATVFVQQIDFKANSYNGGATVASKKKTVPRNVCVWFQYLSNMFMIGGGDCCQRT